MKRLLPTPILSLLLFVVWLCLTSLSVGSALMALVLAIIIPALTYRFWDPQPNLRRLFRLLLYILMVFYDIIVANLDVSRLVLAWRRKPRPAFVVYPLSMTEPFPIAVLANTISLTPGTISAHLRYRDSTLLLHVLDTEDPQAVIAHIHQRYERRLKEIFQC